MRDQVHRRALFAACLVVALVALTSGDLPAQQRTARAASGHPSPSVIATPPPTPSAVPPAPPRPTRTPPSPTVTRAGKGRSPVTIPGPAGSVRDTGGEGVALTFDDGPDPVNTPALLDLLKARGVKATFCVVGFRARNHPAVIRRIAAEGHTLCNHSWQHLEKLSARDDSYLRWDLKSTNDAIHAAAPDAKISYFRAPYGNFTPRVVAFAAEFGMKPIYWDVDDECWTTEKHGKGQQMRDHMVSTVRRNTRPGSVILSHENGKPFVVSTYRTLLPWLLERFTLIPLPV